jgi:hypothetical protein
MWNVSENMFNTKYHVVGSSPNFTLLKGHHQTSISWNWSPGAYIITERVIACKYLCFSSTVAATQSANWAVFGAASAVLFPKEQRPCYLPPRPVQEREINHTRHGVPKLRLHWALPPLHHTSYLRRASGHTELCRYLSPSWYYFHGFLSNCRERRSNGVP